MIEGGEERCHSLFTDAGGDQLLSSWDIALKEKAVSYVGGERLSDAEWEALHHESTAPCSLVDWMSQYSQRAKMCRYVHVYYYLKKPLTSKS